MVESNGDIHFQAEGVDLPSDEYVESDIERRQAEQLIFLRYLVPVFVLPLYAITLIATLTLFYLAGFSIISLADNVLISLSGVLVGEVGVGAILLHIVKSIFTEP